MVPSRFYLRWNIIIMKFLRLFLPFTGNIPPSLSTLSFSFSLFFALLLLLSAYLIRVRVERESTTMYVHSQPKERKKERKKRARNLARANKKKISLAKALRSRRRDDEYSFLAHVERARAVLYAIRSPRVKDRKKERLNVNASLHLHAGGKREGVYKATKAENITALTLSLSRSLLLLLLLQTLIVARG